MPELMLNPQDGTPPLLLSWQAGYGIQPGPLGLGVPPRTLIERARPDGHGVDLVGTVIGPRDITVPLDVYGRTRAEFLQRRRRLQVICGRSSHTRPVRVSYHEDDGRFEWLEGVYVGGLEGDEATGDDRSELFAVRLRAGFPYWRAPQLTESWALTAPARRRWWPVLGSSPRSSLIGGRRTVHIAGDVEVRPPWIVRGPGRDLSVINYTAGWRVDISHELPAEGPGSVLTINTAFGEQSVRDGYSNLFDRITNGPDGGWEMGPLLPGDNDVEVRLKTSGDTSDVSFTYDPLLLAV